MPPTSQRSNPKTRRTRRTVGGGQPIALMPRGNEIVDSKAENVGEETFKRDFIREVDGRK